MNEFATSLFSFLNVGSWEVCSKYSYLQEVDLKEGNLFKNCIRFYCNFCLCKPIYIAKKLLMIKLHFANKSIIKLIAVKLRQILHLTNIIYIKENFR